MTLPMIRRAFADTPHGQIHYAWTGQGTPLLLLHQTPRSWAEYRLVMPILGKKYRVIAMDTVGFGDSYVPEAEGAIEAYARGVVDFLGALSLPRVSLVGHHTGGVIALEVAAAYPHLVDRLVLSCTPYVDAEDRERRTTRPSIDHVDVREDGTHLVELWRRRKAFYPEHRPDLFTSLVIDALKVGERMEEGHRAVNRYHMEERIGLIKAPTLVMAGSEDPFSFPSMKPLAERIKGSRTAVIEGGMVPMVEHMPEEFARVVMSFLEDA